ncbi:hypothetical protein, partial [Hydrogenibacillus schlegelii]|uniref:hypothetical protein n=1 Tax=Hydrogenibacillus schlegelii TaxID=1484 RepID=UPI00349FF833
AVLGGAGPGGKAGRRPPTHRRVEATATPTASFPGERGEIRRSAEATARPAAAAPGDRARAPGGRRHRAGPARAGANAVRRYRSATSTVLTGTIVRPRRKR